MVSRVAWVAECATGGCSGWNIDRTACWWRVELVRPCPGAWWRSGCGGGNARSGVGGSGEHTVGSWGSRPCGRGLDGHGSSVGRRPPSRMPAAWAVGPSWWGWVRCPVAGGFVRCL